MEDLVAAATSKISELVVVMAGGWNTATMEQVFTAGSRTLVTAGFGPRRC
jgi:hypothetical protein